MPDNFTKCMWVGGVIVISDGASNAGASDDDRSSSLSTTLANLRSRGLPVYAIGIGPESLDGDVELVRATAPLMWPPFGIIE